MVPRAGSRYVNGHSNSDGNADIHSDGNADIHSDGNADIHSDGNADTHFGGNADIQRQRSRVRSSRCCSSSISHRTISSLS